MTNINNNDGNVQIADDVLVTIVQTATMEVDGVSSITLPLASDFIGKLSKKLQGTGVHIANEEGSLTIEVPLSIKMGYKIMDIAEKVQQKIKNAIEMMTGLKVLKVNVHVISVDQTKEPKITEEVN